MSELKALRLSVNATQKQMADEMAMSLNDYRLLERSPKVEPARFREATFAALRIAVNRDGAKGLPSTELFEAFDELLHQLDRASQRSRMMH